MVIPFDPGVNPAASPPAASFDTEVDRLLGEVRPAPEWGLTAVAEHGRRVTRFLAALPGDAAPEDVLRAVFRRLADRLRQCGHRPETPATYLRAFRAAQAPPAAAGASPAGGRRPSPPRYEAVIGGPGGQVDDPAECGTYRVTAGDDRRIANCCLFLDEFLTVHDGPEQTERFSGRLVTAAGTRPFSIAAGDYSSKEGLRAALYEAVGPALQLDCTMEEFRNAVAQLSTPREVARTMDFGWDAARAEYRTPGGAVTAQGFRPAGGPGEVVVDLGVTERARHLGLRPLAGGELAELKRHVVVDLLAVHDRVVTWTLTAAVFLAVLHAHAPDCPRFALWLRGRTGVGKSCAAKLFMNFFGAFPVSSGRFASWNSTANSVQREGYYYKDALYLIDDYKPETSRQSDVVRILQANADGSGRGRLRADGTPNPSREVRGLLVATGEDVPEHSASALARSVVVAVPGVGLDPDRFDRCLAWSTRYSGLTADFIHFALAGGHAARFADDVRREQRVMQAGIAGRPNDQRIAGNHALLAAAFRAGCAYLADAWPAAAAAAHQFAGVDLVALRDATVGGSSGQAAGEVFLAALADLVETRNVRIDGWRTQHDYPAGARVVGRLMLARGRPTAVALNIGMCLEAVNDSLRRQRRPEVVVTPRALQEDLRSAGRLLGPDHRPLPPGEPAGGVQARLAGANVRCVLVAPAAVLGTPGEEPDGHGPAPASPYSSAR